MEEEEGRGRIFMRIIFVLFKINSIIFLVRINLFYNIFSSDWMEVKSSHSKSGL